MAEFRVVQDRLCRRSIISPLVLSMREADSTCCVPGQDLTTNCFASPEEWRKLNRPLPTMICYEIDKVLRFSLNSNNLLM